MQDLPQDSPKNSQPSLTPGPNLKPDSLEPVYYARGNKSAFDVHNEVSAPIKELFQYRLLIKNIISRDLKVRYKRSVLGIVWTVLSPLMSMIVLWLVFTKAFQVQIPNFAVFLLSGLITWNFFAQSSTAGCQAILSNAGLIQKIRLPRVIFPVSVVINNAVNFIFAFAALLVVIAITGSGFHWTLILTPIMLIPLMIFSVGWAMLMASLSVFFRDMQYIIEVLLGAAFYLTPILYQPESIPEAYRGIVSINPVAKFIHLIRTVTYTGQVPSFSVMMTSMAIALVTFFIGWVVFHRLQRKFVYWL
jgi:ABC-2 type transport system permease protein